MSDVGCSACGVGRPVRSHRDPEASMSMWDDEAGYSLSDPKHPVNAGAATGLRDLVAPRSSNGQDPALSRRQPEFDSPPGHLREGARVLIVAGDLTGENATIDSWEYKTLAYQHQPTDERLYWLVVDGGFGRVPALREQLASFDEAYG